MAPGEGWSTSPLLELCSSLLSAVRTQVVCICAEVYPRNGKGSGVHSLMRDEAAALLEPRGQYGHFPMSLFWFCSSRSGGRTKGFLNDQKFFFLLPQTRMNTPFVLPRGETGAGIAGQQPLPFTCGSSKAPVVFLPLSEHSVLSFLPGDDDDPYLEMCLLGRSLEERRQITMYKPTVSSLISLKWSSSTATT